MKCFESTKYNGSGFLVGHIGGLDSHDTGQRRWFFSQTHVLGVGPHPQAGISKDLIAGFVSGNVCAG